MDLVKVHKAAKSVAGAVPLAVCGLAAEGGDHRQRLADMLQLLLNGCQRQSCRLEHLVPKIVEADVLDLPRFDPLVAPNDKGRLMHKRILLCAKAAQRAVIKLVRIALDVRIVVSEHYDDDLLVVVPVMLDKVAQRIVRGLYGAHEFLRALVIGGLEIKVMRHGVVIRRMVLHGGHPHEHTLVLVPLIHYFIQPVIYSLVGRLAVYDGLVFQVDVVLEILLFEPEVIICIPDVPKRLAAGGKGHGLVAHIVQCRHH